MGHLSYEEGKKVVFKGLILLGIVTLVEVFIALLGKGYVIEGFHLPRWIMYFAMILLSLYKAYFIVYEFMHMRYEVPGLVKSVLLPTLLLVWMVIAFFYEGGTWREWRSFTQDRAVEIPSQTVGDHSHDKKHSEPNGNHQEETIVKDSVEQTKPDSLKSPTEKPEGGHSDAH